MKHTLCTQYEYGKRSLQTNPIWILNHYTQLPEMNDQILRGPGLSPRAYMTQLFCICTENLLVQPTIFWYTRCSTRHEVQGPFLGRRCPGCFLLWPETGILRLSFEKTSVCLEAPQFSLSVLYFFSLRTYICFRIWNASSFFLMSDSPTNRPFFSLHLKYSTP